MAADRTLSITKLCLKLCDLIAERVGREELFTNILMCFLYLAVLDVRNPERFLFLSGYSSSGKSTDLKILQKLVATNKCFITTAEQLFSNFGLQEFTGMEPNNLSRCGFVTSTFINLLRNLVSSGESQNVQSKFERAALMEFEAFIAMASNKKPFSQQQREGRIHRRMIYVPFTNHVSHTDIQLFDDMFPPQELEKFVSFAVHQDVSLILKFIREVNSDLHVHQVMLESFKDNSKALHLQNFITRQIAYCKDSWIPLGSVEDSENINGSSMFCAYL
uniref:SF3 helicase domain-containing protein n=1 Tax=Caulerpa cliftonii TaxID=1004391 RepID=A0A1C9JBM7_9CHLO|nr:hypothetical protein [Caulerpa cliftonii]AOP19259.1 hypothetical protein [Caulerpa cliftonii]